MKYYRVDFTLADKFENWTGVEALSEAHAKNKVTKLLQENYPDYNFTITKCCASKSPEIVAGNEFVLYDSTYMWLEPIGENTWKVLNLEDNKEYSVVVDGCTISDGPYIIEEDLSYTSEEETPEPIKPGPDVGIASVLNGLIIDEYEAIEGYNTAIATAQAEGYEDIIKILTDIQAEEQLHVGQLQKAMELVDPNAENVISGMKEAEMQLDASDDLTSDDAQMLLNAYENHVKENIHSEK